MTNTVLRRVAYGLVAAVVSAGCAGTAGPVPAAPAAQPSAPGTPPAARATEVTQPAVAPYPYSEADVKFMSGMIPHHAQAVLIAGWAASHGARDDVRILCERIVVGQRDEIALMQTWLRDRGQDVPAADATHMRMTMGNGMTHDMLMPGMLTEEELAKLDQSRGPDFDRLFLTYMIKHHQGAITMVDELFESYGAAQDDTVFRFASDVYADQTTEIDRMYTMLAGGGSPS